MPLIVTWTRGGLASVRNAPPKRYLEAALLAAGLLIVGLVSFGARDVVANNTPVLLYLPLPVLLSSEEEYRVWLSPENFSRDSVDKLFIPTHPALMVSRPA